MKREQENSCDPPIQLRAEFQFPFADSMDTTGSQLWDGVGFRPLRYSPDSDLQSPGCRLDALFLRIEVRQHVVFEHAVDYSMLYGDVNYADGGRLYPMPMETMGDRIRVLRQAKGLSQADLAERLKVTHGAVSQWENGGTKNIKLHTFLSLCDELGTDPQFLIFGPSRSAPPPPGRRQA